MIFIEVIPFILVPMERPRNDVTAKIETSDHKHLSTVNWQRADLNIEITGFVDRTSLGN